MRVLAQMASCGETAALRRNFLRIASISLWAWLSLAQTLPDATARVSPPGVLG